MMNLQISQTILTDQTCTNWLKSYDKNCGKSGAKVQINSLEESIGRNRRNGYKLMGFGKDIPNETTRCSSHLLLLG